MVASDNKDQDDKWIMTALSDSIIDNSSNDIGIKTEDNSVNLHESPHKEANAKLRRLIEQGARMVLAKKDGNFTSKEDVLTQLLTFEYCNLELEKTILKLERINQQNLGLSLNQVKSLSKQLTAIAKHRNEEDKEKLLSIVAFLEQSKEPGINGPETQTIIHNLDDIHSFNRIFDKQKLEILVKKIEATLAAIPENSTRKTKYTRKFCDLLKKLTQMEAA